MTGLSSWAARVHVLQRVGESGAAQEMLPADVIVTIDGAVEDLNRYFTSFLLSQTKSCNPQIVRLLTSCPAGMSNKKKSVCKRQKTELILDHLV